jgi:hypothetical protein
LRDHRVALPDDEELLHELANVRFRQTSPGALIMDHDPDKHDDGAIALALAAFALVEHPPARGGFAVTMAARAIGVDFGVRVTLIGVRARPSHALDSLHRRSALAGSHVEWQPKRDR